jgi:hypothetical protein
MAGLVPAIHVVRLRPFLAGLMLRPDVDHWDKPGDDENRDYGL